MKTDGKCTVAATKSELVFDKTTLMAIRVATALVRAIEEHGAPNTFSFGELAPNQAMFAGRAVRARWGSFLLNVYSRTSVHSIELVDGRISVTGSSGELADVGGRLTDATTIREVAS